jgi:hypothetical protein
VKMRRPGLIAFCRAWLVGSAAGFLLAPQVTLPVAETLAFNSSMTESSVAHGHGLPASRL